LKRAENRWKKGLGGMGLILCLGMAVPAWGQGESLTLKYTYRPDQASVSLLHDMEGKTYLPLAELAHFYGITVDFDPAERRVTLSKGGNQVKMVLSQSVFMTSQPSLSFPMDPLEVVSGQVGIPPDSAEDVLGAVLNINVQYLPDQRVLVAGGIQKEQLRQEILAQSGNQEAPPPAAAAPAPEARPVPTPTVAPSPSQEPEAETQAPAPEKAAPEGVLEEEPSPKQVYRVRRVVIDAGHGGIDRGATGYDGKYFEKQATLDIAEKVAGLLRREDPGLEVLLTRHDDHYISLKRRTQFANNHDADLFVSIHCNANRNTQAQGTEIYVYNTKASNKLAAMAALRENFGTDFTPLILADLRYKNYKDRSEYLAEKLESLIRERLHQHFRRILRGPFYVLGAVDMPSILIETAFITNPHEEKKIENPDWREKIARVIADGITAYREKVEETFENEQARR
jgi:N-acetylmuramoyl-L-alanine amidase